MPWKYEQARNEEIRPKQYGAAFGLSETNFKRDINEISQENLKHLNVLMEEMNLCK